MALPNAVPEVFDNAFEGVNSSVSAEMISPTQTAWAKNVANRGGKPGTRPPLIYRMSLPSGLVQGASYFGVQGGMGVAMVAGRAWRLRINPNSYSAEQITLPFNNSGIIKRVYMQQTVESLVIQDGQSDAIIYNGSTAVRSDPSDGGVPRGTVMAYGNGRLWVAINSKELVAGDIRTNTAGSELRFTETNYLSGGGKLYFPRGITALGFIATTGTSDYGALLVFGLDYTEAIKADITFRDLWAQTPGFVTNVLRHTGCASHWSLAEINQDLYWRDAGGGIRSIRSALADESGPGNSPISREISRLTDYDSRQILGFSSAISFNNRLISTMSPCLNESHGVSWKNLAPLDFAPMSTMRGKSLPAYDGQWDGLNFTHLFQGQFQGRSRAFAVATTGDGENSLWEIMEDGRGGLDDVTVFCSNGSANPEESPITSFIEYGARSFGDNKRRKTLERCDVFLKDLLGDLNLKVYWRSDNNQKWLQWDELDVCAKNGDPDQTTSPHVWKNILSQQRPQIKTFTIPTDIDLITRYGLQTGFEFQIRIVWTGRVKIDRMTLWARYVDDPQWSIRDVVLASCLTNDVTGNEVTYAIPFTPCPPPPAEPPIFEQYTGPFEAIYLTQSVEGDTRILFSFNFLGLDHSHEAGELPLSSTTHGMKVGAWSGEATYDPQTETYDGQLTATETGYGALPGGVNYIIPAGAPVTVTGNTFDELLYNFNNINGSLSGFSSRSYTEGTTADGTFVRKWFSETPGPAISGFFVSWAMNSIWSDGWTLTATYSNQQTPADEGLPITLTGEGARTQHITGYDPETFTYTGTKSRVRENVEIPFGKTKLYGEFKYLVTPDDGSDPYYYYDSKEYDVTANTTYNAVTWFPWIVDATVYYVSGEFSFIPTYFLGWSSAESDLIYQESLPLASSWPELVEFGYTQRYSYALDDFDDWGGQDTTASVSNYLYNLNTGTGWETPWEFYGVDRVQVGDDFSAYEDGTISNWTQGYGWASPGRFFYQIRPQASDDFETYPDGPIDSWNVNSDFWKAPGVFYIS